MLKTWLVISLLLLACSCGKTADAGDHSVHASPTITLLGRTYHLASYNQTAQPNWEFVIDGEDVQNWTTIITIIDRPDAPTPRDLDRLAEGIMQNYKSHGGQILLAKTFPSPQGAYNYLVAAFEEAARTRFELNFAKAAMGPKNAYVIVYGVRVTDPRDYLRKGREYLNLHSSEIGMALEKFVLPDLSTFPRKEF
jgi:hypothetical protein